MKILIFGASGTLGQHIVTTALEKGHEVTAFARGIEKLGHIENPNLTLVRGDVLSYQAVYDVVKGQDAVFCALGAGRKGSVRSQGTANIVKAMESHEVKRFVCQTTLGAGESHQNLDFFWKRIMFGWFLKEAFLDHEKQEEYIKSSKVDWTIVRPGAFTNGTFTGKYQHGFPPTEKSIKLKVSRSDVAHFMLEQLTTEEYVRQTPGLSY